MPENAQVSRKEHDIIFHAKKFYLPLKKKCLLFKVYLRKEIKKKMSNKNFDSFNNFSYEKFVHF